MGLGYFLIDLFLTKTLKYCLTLGVDFTFPKDIQSYLPWEYQKETLISPFLDRSS